MGDEVVHPKKKSLGSTAFADIDEEIGALEN